MKQAILVLAVILLGFGASAARSQTPEAASKVALAEGEAANAKAGELKNQWPPAAAALAAARKAADAGDYDNATKLAQEAKALAEASIAQALREKDLWRDSELR
jgi:hypothetical protein